MFFCISLIYSSLAISAQHGSVLEKHAFIDLFVDIALGREPSSEQLFPNEPRIVLKWAAPLNLRILTTAGVRGDQVRPKVRRTMRTFLEIASNLNIQTKTVNGNVWNYLFYFYSGREGVDELVEVFSANEWRKRYPGVVEFLIRDLADPTVGTNETCLFKISYSQQDGTLGEIRDAVVILPSDATEEAFSSCFFEQTAQALGLPNDIDEQRYGVETLFDHRLEGENLSELDLKLLRTLYNPKIKPGMDEQDVRAVLRNVLDLQ